VGRVRAGGERWFWRVYAEGEFGVWHRAFEGSGPEVVRRRIEGDTGSREAFVLRTQEFKRSYFEWTVTDLSHETAR